MDHADYEGVVTSARTDASPPLRDCDRRFNVLEQTTERNNILLIGDDGRGGLVKDTSEKFKTLESRLDKIDYQTGAARYAINVAVTFFLTIGIQLAMRWLNI